MFYKVVGLSQRKRLPILLPHLISGGRGWFIRHPLQAPLYHLLGHAGLGESIITSFSVSIIAISGATLHVEETRACDLIKACPCRIHYKLQNTCHCPLNKT